MTRVPLLILLALAGPFCTVAHASTLVPASALEDAAVTQASIDLDPTVVAQVEEATAMAPVDAQEEAEAEEPAEADATGAVPAEALPTSVTDAPAPAAKEPEATEAAAEDPAEVPAEVPTEAPAEVPAVPEATEAPAIQPPAPVETAPPAVTAPTVISTAPAAVPAQVDDTAVKPTVAVESPEGMSSGQVVGIVIGALLALIVLIVVVVAVYRRMGRYSKPAKKTKKSKAQENILVSPLRRKTGKKERRPVFWKLNY